MKSLLRLWALAAALCTALAAQAQIVVTSPAFPTMDDSITLTFDAIKGNAGLAGVTTNVYGHFGLVVGGPDDFAWTRTVGTWGVAFPRTLMTRVAPNLYQISFVPRHFFANTVGVTGYKLAMVFRNTTGSQAGRTETGGDIYVPLYQPGNHVRFTTPTSSDLLLQPSSTQPYLIESSSSANLTLYDNNAPVNSVIGSNVLSGNLSSLAAGVHQLRAVADFSGDIQADTINLLVVGAPKTDTLPTGMRDGVTYVSPTSAYLVLAAPGKHNVFVKGDFNNWGLDTAYYMRRTPDSSRFWLRIDNLIAGQEYVYQYYIDGALTVGDPLCDKTSDPSDNGIPVNVYPNPVAYPTGKATGVASVLRPGRAPYIWSHERPAPIPRERLTVYELHLRDFLGRTQDKTFQGLTDTLAYLQKLGINAVELMPVSEFEGNQSWGYNVSFHGAVDKTYGPDDRLRALVDSCHGRGMYVILDVVYNHAFDQSPLVQMYPRASSPYINDVAKHDFNVGNDLNHESPYTRAYIDRCNQRWLEDFRVDGFRFDLSKGFTQTNTLGNTAAWAHLDRSRIRNIARIADVCRASYPGVMLILEHFADNDEEKILSDSLNLMPWGNLAGAGQGALAGTSNSSGDMNWGYYAARGWQLPNLVTFLESHDEERTMYNAFTNGRQTSTYNVRDYTTAIERAKALAVIFLAQPGPKMMWEFQELGYDQTINRCPSGTINTTCRTDPKPVLWNYYTSPAESLRHSLYQVYQAMLHLRASEPAFSTTTNVSYTLNSRLQKRFVLRAGADGDVVVLANLDVASNNYLVGFTQPGRWYEYFSGDSLDVTDIATQRVNLFAGDARIYSTKRFGTPAVPNLITGNRAVLATQGAIHLMPNPTTGHLHLDGPAGMLTCTLMGTDGRQLATRTLSAAERELDLTSLPGGKPAPGLYLLQVSPSAGKTARLRLLVE